MFATETSEKEMPEPWELDSEIGGIDFGEDYLEYVRAFRYRQMGARLALREHIDMEWHDMAFGD